MPELPLLGGLPATGLRLFAAEFAITVTNADVWRAIALAVVLGLMTFAFGRWASRIVGLLPADAPVGETIGVGLASGLTILAAWWATIWSGGRSSFTIVGIGFAIAITLGFASRRRRPSVEPVEPVEPARPGEPESSPGRSTLTGLLLAASFIVVIALLYGTTLAPSPRDGVQPVEFSDEAFYAVLGRDLATTGTESTISPSGFDELPGVPEQTWYHWAELWLASAVIAVFGVAPMAARYLIVLPVVLLAAATLTGTVVRRMTGSTSRRSFLFGIGACLFLAPVPLPGAFFASWAVGMIFSVTLYGQAAVLVLLAIYGVVMLGRRPPRHALAVFAACGAASIVPAHVVIAALGVVATGSASLLWIGRWLKTTRHLPNVPMVWWWTVVTAAVLAGATFVWSRATGHGLAGSESSPVVEAFNLAWILTMAAVYVGAGVMLALPIGALALRWRQPVLASACFGAGSAVAFGAIAWGARLSDFNMYHVFFAGLTVFAVPIAAAACWAILDRLVATGRIRLARTVAVIGVLQLAVGVAAATVRLQEFGPRLHNVPIPLEILSAIDNLPNDAKLAYACRPFEEFAFADPSLLSIDAHTGHRIVPVCFQADVFSTLNGVLPSDRIPTGGWVVAPQSSIYPDSEARPASATVARWLHDHGIDYIYADSKHVNVLVPDAVPVATSGSGVLLRVP